MMHQRTIRKSVHGIGIGVHSGEKVAMTLRPGAPNTGIVFARTDLNGTSGAIVPARAHLVSDTMLSTSVGNDLARVATVEHLMSALWGMGIDNLVVELSAEEVPIMDGSARPFIELIQAAGIVEQDEAKRYIRITHEIRVTQGDAYALLRPYDGFKAEYTFVANHSVYDRYPSFAAFDFSTTSFVDAVGGARSFGLMNELADAQAINKCLGSSLSNAVGIDEDAVINPEGLRYEDEFVKHKLLDAIGDLYLLGSPILGEFVGFKSGHTLNNKMARAVLRCDDAWEYVEVGACPKAVVETPILQPAAISPF